jgi:PKD repeat protein
MAAAAPSAFAGFLPHVDYPTGANPQAVAIGDLNGDGILDVVTANPIPRTLSVLLGNGDGTFGPHSDYAAGGQANSVAIGDVNGDGKPDLAVTNYGEHTLSVFLGNGDGTFGTNTDYGMVGSPQGIQMADLNADGKLDLVTANGSIDNVSVLLNNGNGTFGPRTEFGTGNLPSALAIADVNGDGKPDLATGNSMLNGGPTANTISVLLGNGNGTFGANTNYPTGNNPVSLAIGDLNGDGHPDLVAGNQVSAGPGLWTVSVLLGNGTGSFGAKTDYPTGRSPVAVVIGDLDIDGKVDIATAGMGAGPASAVSVLPGNGDGSFGTRTHYGVAQGPVSLAMGELNGDGRPDLVTSNYQTSGTVSVLINTPFPPPVANFSGSPTSGPAPLSVQFTDLSTNAPTSWSWTFGDNGTSTAQNPSHSYNADGSYTVTLIATNGFGSTTETKVSYITVTTPPAPNIHVQSITVTRLMQQGNQWVAVANVTIVDETGAPVSAATVAGNFTAPNARTRTGITNASGVAVVTSAKTKPAPPIWCFNVGNVTKSGEPYDPSQNVEGTDCDPPLAEPAIAADAREATPLASRAELRERADIVTSSDARIELTLDTPSQIRIEVFDITGRSIARLADEFVPAGVHGYQWDSRRARNGIYFYHAQGANALKTGKIVVVGH